MATPRFPRGNFSRRGHIGPKTNITAAYSAQFRKQHGRTPKSFGEALAGLGKSRKEAFEIFCDRLCTEYGFGEEAARKEAELRLSEQYDPAVVKFRQKE